MGGYTLALHAYCGMTVPIDDDMDRDEARRAAARLVNTRRRQGFPVAVLEPGRRWEIMEPDDAVMVSDDSGILVLRGPGEEVPL